MEIKSKLLPVLLCLAFLGGGFALGRYAAPAKVVVTEKVQIVQVEKQVVVTQVKTEVQKIYVSETQKNTHREETDIKHPDGTVEKKVTTDQNVNKVVKEQEVKYVDRWNERVVEKQVVVTQEKTVVVQNDIRPKWEVGVLGGADLAHLGSGGVNLIPGLPSAVVVGVDVQRRLIGPIKVGAWGTSSGLAGLKLSMEF